MKIHYTKLFVNDQNEALKFYTEILGFIRKTDVTKGEYRWLTVVSPEDQDGTELILERNDNPVAKAYQEAIFAQGAPATNFDVSDVHTEHERLQKLGAIFTLEPMQVMEHVTIAILDDTCGNLIQIQQTGRK